MSGLLPEDLQTVCFRMEPQKYFLLTLEEDSLIGNSGMMKRVVCMEKTNMRYVKPEDIGELADFISIDVSFISLTKILPPVKACLKEDGQVVCLIKPQFEAGREKVGKKRCSKRPTST